MATVTGSKRKTALSVETINGRDVNADTAKLDGIEAGATADQTKADIDALGINADLLDGYHASSFSLTSHSHSLNALSNTTITSVASGEILKWNGSAWINNTLAEAGIQPAGSYLTGNQTITLTGDVSGSGTTSIAVTIADDSHNHIIGNVDGLQTALDGKAASSHTHNASDINAGTLGSARLPAASETAIGALERATQAEAEAGTDNARAMTPLRVKQAIDANPAGDLTGGGTDKVIVEYEQTIDSDYSISANRNALTAGPITIADNATLTIPTSSIWSVV